MRNLPKVAIVGRPNVGKSALFNRLLQKRIAIVDDFEGITRDRLYREAEGFGTAFCLIDTGGIAPKSDMPFQKEVLMQAEIAIAEADHIICVVDGQVGPTDLDEAVGRLLHQSETPITLAINKVDNDIPSDLHHSFYSLGIKDTFFVSSLHGHGIADMLEHVAHQLPEKPAVDNSDKIRVSLVGRPNVGKSTLLNTLFGDDRVIVSEIPGTTRDAIDTNITYDDIEYTFVDTAGIRRKNNRQQEVVDKFATIRTHKAMEHSDIAVLLCDTVDGLTDQEKKIASTIHAAGKGLILFFNKWDKVKGFQMEHALQKVVQEAPHLRHVPVMFGSAKTGKNLKLLFKHIKEVHEALHMRLPTHKLNTLIMDSLQKYHPPMIQGKRLRIYYLAQISTYPPRFVLFVNKPDLMTKSYQQYLLNQLRKKHPFPGVPIHFHLRHRAASKTRA